MTIHLNDYKFMEKIMFIFVSTVFYLKDFQTNIMGLKPRINIQQFFKYGYAEQKMMMCVDTITRVKEMAKEIRINSSLSSSRKMTVRQSSQSGERMSQIHSPLRNNMTSLKYKHNTLAELQEEMRMDFQTQTQKESQKYLSNQKKRRSRKESLESSLRLTGSKAHQTINRHRYPLEEDETDLKSQTLPLRSRNVKEAIEDEKSFTHKLNETELMVKNMEA